MHIEDLKTFCDLVDTKSFTEAAERNYVTQSAVSQQIRKFEKYWKAPLLERSRTDLRLTKAGEIVYQQAKKILESYDHMNRLLSKSTKVVGGTMKVAAIHGVGLHELPPYVKRFLKLYPLVKMKLEYKKDQEVYEEVLKLRADMGIVAYPKRHPSLWTIPFRDDELGVVCHPGHPLARAKSVSLKDLHKQKMVVFEKNLPTRKAVDHALTQEHVKVEIAMEFDNIETLKRAVEIEAGLSILPLVTVQNEVQNKTLCALKIRGKPLVRPLGILVRRDHAQSQSVAKFIDLLTASQVTAYRA